MFAAIVTFIHARKWLVELILLAAIAGAIWWFCHHLIDVGVQRERAAWTQKLEEAQRNAALETARLKDKAEAAEKANAQELSDLRKYRADHPLHGRLCQQASSSLPPAGSIITGITPASPEARDFLAMPERDRNGDQGEPDQLGMLDALAAVADAVSGQLREYQAR